MIHPLAALATGVAGSVATGAGAAMTFAAEAGTSDLGPFVTGGGALTTAGVLGWVAVKLTRGELVARDPDKVEKALLRLVDDRKDDHAQVVELLGERTALLERALTALNNRSGGTP